MVGTKAAFMVCPNWFFMDYLCSSGVIKPFTADFTSFSNSSGVYSLALTSDRSLFADAFS